MLTSAAAHARARPTAIPQLLSGAAAPPRAAPPRARAPLLTPPPPPRASSSKSMSTTPPPAPKSSCPFAGLIGTTPFPVDAAKEAYEAVAAKTRAPQAQPQFGAASSCSPDQYRAFAQAVVAAIGDGTLQAPKAARLGFHASFTYSPASGPSGLGGPNGAWIGFPHELAFPENAGLAEPLQTIKALKAQHPGLTLADAIAFASAIAVEVAGGPPIAWMPGRRDALSHDATGAVALAARMPDGAFNGAAVAYSFANAGLSARDAVALIGGGHSFGAMDLTGSGWDGCFTPAGDAWCETAKNRYFIDLTTLEWEPTTVEGTGRVQYVPKPGQDGAVYTAGDGTAVVRMPSDMALLEHPTFADLARLYARDEATFLSDFARSYQRMLQLGAGEGAWSLMPEKFEWLGLSGKATNYGVAIAPM
jgi:hypothetical protein